MHVQRVQMLLLGEKAYSFAERLHIMEGGAKGTGQDRPRRGPCVTFTDRQYNLVQGPLEGTSTQASQLAFCNSQSTTAEDQQPVM